MRLTIFPCYEHTVHRGTQCTLSWQAVKIVLVNFEGLQGRGMLQLGCVDSAAIQGRWAVRGLQDKKASHRLRKHCSQHDRMGQPQLMLL